MEQYGNTGKVSTYCSDFSDSDFSDLHLVFVLWMKWIKYYTEYHTTISKDETFMNTLIDTFYTTFLEWFMH